MCLRFDTILRPPVFGCQNGWVAKPVKYDFIGRQFWVCENGGVYLGYLFMEVYSKYYQTDVQFEFLYRKIADILFSSGYIIRDIRKP